jgi:hypothetical protein
MRESFTLQRGALVTFGNKNAIWALTNKQDRGSQQSCLRGRKEGPNFEPGTFLTAEPGP